MIEYVRQDAKRRQKEIDRAEIHSGFSTAESLFEDWRERERRSNARYEVTGRAVMTIFGGRSGSERIRFQREGFTRDLSVTGVCLVLKGPGEALEGRLWLDRKAKVRLELKEGGEEPLILLARVAWVKQSSGGVRLGLEFTGVTEKQKEILESCCRKDDGELRRMRNLWQVLVSDVPEKE